MLFPARFSKSFSFRVIGSLNCAVKVENNIVVISSQSLTNICGVPGREVERRPRNHEVPSSSLNFEIFIGPHIRREYWCSSQETESKEISLSF